MSNKIFFIIFVVKLIFKPHVKGLVNNLIESTSSPDSDAYYDNETTTMPNILNSSKSIKVNSSKLNSASNAISEYTSTNNIPQFMRFQPLEEDNYIKVDPFILKQYGKHFDSQLDEYTASDDADTSSTETVVTYDTTRRVTYPSTSYGPHITARIWEPDEPVVASENVVIDKKTLSAELSVIGRAVTKKLSNLREFVSSNSSFTRGRALKPKNKCKKFVASKVPFDYKQMENIWQTMYYRIPDKIKCFQILIKNISQQQRDIYERNYGNFSGVVDWQNIRLEISATTNIGRKHFLQDDNREMGVFENIVISRDIDTGELMKHEETPDQWLVVGHLLLMRDCDNGGIVVFSKVPYVPLRLEIENALAKFNEEYSTGKLTCDEDEVINKHIEAEEDVQSFWNN